MKYYGEYYKFLRDSLTFLQRKIDLGYKLPVLMDNIIEFTQDGYQVIQKQRMLYYRFTQEFGKELLEIPSAKKIKEMIIKDQEFVNSLNTGRPEGIEEEEFLNMWIPYTYILQFLGNYLDKFKYSKVMDFTINEAFFLEIVSDLELYVSRPNNITQVLIPLWNSKVKLDEILLSENIHIRKLTDDERRYIIKNHLGMSSMSSLLDCPFHGLEIIYDSLKVSQEELNNSIEKLIFLLRLLKPSTVYASIELSRAYPHTMGDNDYAMGWKHTFTPLGELLDISKDDISSLQELWNDINNDLVLEHKMLNRIKNRFNILQLSSDPADKIIDSVIILESLFLNGTNSELSYRLSLRIAVFIETDFEARKALKEFIKKLYGFRSKLVHGIEISKKDMRVNGKQLDLNEVGNQAERIVRECIKKIIHEIKIMKSLHADYFDDILLM